MLNQYSDSAPGQVKAFQIYSGNVSVPVTVLDFYGMRGDIMGSLGACVALLATTTLSFAICGACAVTKIRHSSR